MKFIYDDFGFSGIQVKGFEDRMDLYSVMIKGPKRTPYEDGLFFFDFQLSADYPRAPPICHYHSYVTDRLNPNLYEDGKFINFAYYLCCDVFIDLKKAKANKNLCPNSQFSDKAKVQFYLSFYSQCYLAT